MNIAEQIKKRRIELQMSQETAADKAGISRRTLAYYESGERIPNAENLLILCKLYGLDVNELISTSINDKNPSDENNISSVVDEIENYLKFEQAKKDNFRKTILIVALIFTGIIVISFILLMIFKFVLMSSFDYSFSQATATMWTSLFEALIAFVNDPKVMKFPIVSVAVLSTVALGWIMYFLVKFIKKHRN